jgi:hypothetical protein
MWVNGSPWAATIVDETFLLTTVLRIVLVSAPIILYGQFTLQLVPGFPRLFDRPFVLNGRDVAWVATEGDCMQHAAHNLAAACLGQDTHKFDLANDRDGT